MLSDGWSGPDGDGEYMDPDGKYHEALPAGSSDGMIAIVNAIPDMGVLAKLDISNNHIEQGEPLQLITELCNTKGIELDHVTSTDLGL
jgi:hypothetical protein